MTAQNWPERSVDSADLDEWVARARGLAPVVAQWRDESEHARRMPSEMIDAMKANGLFRLWVPRQLGGFEVSPQIMIAVVEELAALDGSVAWLMMAAANSALLAGQLSEAGAAEVFGPPDSLVAGSLHPGGTATAVQGGWTVSGRWRLATGVLNASWLICAARVLSGGSHDDAGRQHIFFVHFDDCEVLEVWDPPGLRGTGTHDFCVSDVFVPSHRHVPPGGHRSFSGALYSGQLAHFINPPLAAVAIGLARDALCTFQKLARTKASGRDNRPMIERHTIHDVVGRSYAEVQCARSSLHAVVNKMWSAALSGDGVPEAVTAEVLVMTALATDLAAKAIDRLFTASGSTSVVSPNRLERCFRDVHVVNHHDAASPFMFERMGRYRLFGSNR